MSEKKTTRHSHTAETFVELKRVAEVRQTICGDAGFILVQEEQRAKPEATDRLNDKQKN